MVIKIASRLNGHAKRLLRNFTSTLMIEILLSEFWGMAKDRRQSTTELPVATDNDTTHECRGYGWFAYRPNHLQSCLSPRWILVCCSMLIFTESFIVTGVLPVVVTSIEKRYFLQSSQIGVIYAFYEIGNTILTIVVSYFGHYHKPKWLGLGSLVLGLGCLIFALPQLLIGQYEPAIAQTADLCQNNQMLLNTSNASETNCKSSKWYNMLVFAVGQFIIGAGCSPVYNLGAASLDENTSRENSGVYLGIYYAVSIIGSGMGFILGGHFLTIYIDIAQVCFSITVDIAQVCFSVTILASWSDAKIVTFLKYEYI